jgi:hypothetical protein
MQTTASWNLTLGSAGGSPQPTPIETIGGWLFQGQAGRHTKTTKTWVGSHCLLSSSLHSGLLYLNDDFQGGDLFFTQPNALTVTVGVYVGVTEGPAGESRFKTEASQRQMQGNG